MKKIVFAVLAIGAMAACTKQNVQYEQTGELTLAPVTQKATKAAVADAVYPTTEKFNVWAWWGNDDATGTSTTPVDYTQFATKYLVDATFAKRDAGNWGGWDMNANKINPYYWPTTGSLVFAGYSPAEAKGTFTYGNNGLPTTEVFTATNFVQDKDITKTVDLMWFERTSKSYDQKTASSGVPVVFKHALSWLTFKFKLKDNNTPNNWKITKVELKGIEDKGSFSSSNKKPWGIASDATSNDVEVFKNDSGYDELTNTAVTLEGSSAITSGGSVLVIPQSCAPANGSTPAAAELVITYSLMIPATANGTEPQYLTGQTITLPLNGGTGASAWEEWEAGKHYIYTITFGANEILIAPTVDTWGTVNQNIEVQ